MIKKTLSCLVILTLVMPALGQARSTFEEQALAETGFSPIEASANTKPESLTALHHLLDGQSAIRPERRKTVYTLAFLSVAAFLASAGWYKDFAMGWTKGSLGLEFVAMELISVVAKLLAVILSQLMEHRGPLKKFRINKSEIGWALLVAMVFSTPIEGLYYEYGLPLVNAMGLAKLVTLPTHLFTATDLWAINALGSVFRSAVDQIISVLWLDGFNIFLASLFVKKMSRKMAQDMVKKETLPFYERSSLLWFSTVLFANFFSRPYINFMVINAGMIFWEIFLAAASGRSLKDPLSLHARPLRILQRALLDQAWHMTYQLIWSQTVYWTVLSVGLHFVAGLSWSWSMVTALPIAIALVQGIMRWHAKRYPLPFEASA